MQGKGEMKLSDGRKFVGSYENNLRHGFGIMFNTDGSKYSGEWEKDQEHGYGTHTDQFGEETHGEHQNGTRTSVVIHNLTEMSQN